MKAILMSIRPKWVAKILNGEKTVEIRKKFPKDYRGWVYIYCTKYYFVHESKGKMFPVKHISYSNEIGFLPKRLENVDHSLYYDLRGKVVARFWCDNVERYVNGCKLNGEYSDYEYILKPSCLTEDELYDYCEDLSFSAIYITKLEIFDKPKKLCEFGTPTIKLNGFIGGKKPLTKSPQSYQFIEVGEWYV